MATKGYNPFDNVSAVVADDDEEFLSDEAAAAQLAEDELEDNFEFADTTISGCRMTDETFQNMTIGQYLRMGSDVMGSASFLKPVNDDTVVTSDSMSDDQQSGNPAHSPKEVDIISSQNQDEGASHPAEEPTSLFSNSIFLKMDESIPHSPPSFLQTLDSSGLCTEKLSTNQPTKDFLDAAGLGSYRGYSDVPSTKVDSVHQASERNASATNHDAVTNPFQSAELHGFDNGEGCDKNDDNSVLVTTSEPLRQSSSLSTTHVSTLASESSLVSRESIQEFFKSIPISTTNVIPKVPDQPASCSSISKSDIPQAWDQSVFKVPLPPKDNRQVTTGSQGILPPSSPRDILASTQCPPNMSSISMLLSNSTIRVDDEEWDFTLSDINQMVEGIGDMDLDAAFAQIVAKKKEKIKQQKAVGEKQKQTVDANPPARDQNNLVSKEQSELSCERSGRNPGSEAFPSSLSGCRSLPSLLQGTTSAAAVPGSYSYRFSDAGAHASKPTAYDVATPQSALDDSIRKLMESVRPGFGGNGDNVYGDNSMLGADDSVAGVTLLCDNNNETLPNNINAMDFAASTPMFNHRPNSVLSDLEILGQSAIHHLVTPHRIQEMLDLPTHVDVPEVCCVLLSQEVQFTVRNKLRSGVQCTFSITKMAFNGKVVDGCVCPFDFNRRITLRPNSHESVQVLFAPTCAGHFYASMEVIVQNLTNAEETRSYEVNLTGRAELPKLKVLPNSEEIDFGDLIWGSSDHKTIKVQNVGQATVPVRFTVIRTNSPLCTFSFQSSDNNNNPDISRTSLTSRPPNAIHSVISVPLLGVREGEQPTTQSINVYCHIKGVDTSSRKYSEACEVFEGVLSMELDSLMPRQRHLTQFRLRVKAGMVKLHLDRSSLILSSPPGQPKEGAVKVVNSGNISMKVSLDLDPPTDLFHVAPRQMLVEPHAYQMARVTFTPQDHSNVDVQLVLSDQLCINFLPVRGQTKQHIVTKINANASSISFGGVSTGNKISKTFKFSLDQDVKVKCFIRQGIASAFQIALEDGTVQDEVMLSMTKGIRSAVHIVFIPEEVNWFSSTLVLQVIHGDSFSIPLSGYGGVSSLKFSGLTETKSGETVIPMDDNGHGAPFTHSVTVTNTGIRCAFVKTVFQDKSHNVISPHQATVMPSELFLAPQESREMVIWMLHQPDSDKYRGQSGMSLKGIVKLSYGDEINRNLLRRNQSSECQRLALNYILELTQDQKNQLSAEMHDIPGDLSISTNSFKSSVKSKKIGLFTGIDRMTQDQPRSSALADSRSVSGPSLTLGSRPVLQTVSLNVQQQQQIPPTKMDKEWTLSPVSISFKVLDARSKDFAQIINYADKELRFFVETDDCLSVVPSKGVVATKSWCQLELMTSGKFWSSRNKPSCALIKVRCNEETKHLRVLIEGATVNKMTFPPVFSAQDAVSAESSGRSVMAPAPSTRGTQLSLGADGIRGSSTGEEVKSHRLARSCHQEFSTPDTGSSKGIFGPEMAIIPPVSLGNRTEFTYAFTNVSQEVVSWKVLAMGPLSCEPASRNLCLSMESSVFYPRPHFGTLEAGGVQTIALCFTPQAVGSYRQMWGIEHFGVTCSNLHKFTIYAKANSRESQSGTQEVPTSLSPKRQQQKHQHVQPLAPNYQQPPSQTQPLAKPHTQQITQAAAAAAADNLPKWTSCQPQSSAPSHPRSSSGITTTASITNKTSTTTPAALASTEKTRQPSESGDKATSSSGTAGRCLQLMEKVLRFSTLSKGRGETLYLKLSNTSPRDADITVEQQPGAPFIIRHTNFTVRKDRMTKLPVVFKPLHVAKFREQVVMREKHTNATFTALLEAECVP